MYIKYEGNQDLARYIELTCSLNLSYTMSSNDYTIARSGHRTFCLSESKVKDSHFKISSNNQKSNGNLYDRTGESMENLCLFLVCCILVPWVNARGSGKKGVGVNPYGYLCDDINAFTNIHWW